MGAPRARDRSVTTRLVSFLVKVLLPGTRSLLSLVLGLPFRPLQITLFRVVPEFLLSRFPLLFSFGLGQVGGGGAQQRLRMLVGIYVGQATRDKLFKSL